MNRSSSLVRIERDASVDSASEASGSWGQQALEVTSSLFNEGTEKLAVVRPCMAKSIFQFVKDSLPKLGSADPLWLKQEEEPVFKTVEMGTQGPEIGRAHV